MEIGRIDVWLYENNYSAGAYPVSRTDEQTYYFPRRRRGRMLRYGSDGRGTDEADPPSESDRGGVFYSG